MSAPTVLVTRLAVKVGLLAAWNEKVASGTRRKQIVELDARRHISGGNNIIQ